MAGITVSLKKCPALITRIERVMRRLHPRIDPQEHKSILKTIGNLTLGGSTTTVSEVIVELRIRGICSHLSDGQIRSRIKDLEKESFITMDYRGPRLFFVHRTKRSITWKKLMELLKELKIYLKKSGMSTKIGARMKALEHMRAQGNFIGFIRVYNSIVVLLGWYIIEIRGVAKRIELTSNGWIMYPCL
jgi:hypothetical protein